MIFFFGGGENRKYKAKMRDFSRGTPQKMGPPKMENLGSTMGLIFKGYNPYIGGLKPSFFMVLGSKGIFYTPLENYTFWA